ncbi:MAG TPA: GAF domain-containing protein [Acidimicrobiales bacterium]|nr:GAF domain-containing protein [Acidimicrobiales bacterium]
MDPATDDPTSNLRRLLDAVLTIGSGLDLPAMLRRIVEAATELVDARFGALGVLDETGTHLAEFITVGLPQEARRSIGDLPHGHGILGLLIVDPKPLRLHDLREHAESFGFPANHPAMTSFLGVPVRLRDQVFGNLYLTDKKSAGDFTDLDEELTVALAAAAGVAIENARLHARVRELVLLEDRERIARDLHDTVIQRLFATGLALQGTARLAERQDVIDRIETAVDDLDLTVKQIRSAIFGLETTRTAGGGLREKVLALVTEAAGPLGFEPHVRFDGAIDTIVSRSIGEQLLATLREALSNVAKHASATRVDVEVSAFDSVELRVTDDGVGIDPAERARVDGTGHGLKNMAARAARVGGSFEVGRGAHGHGTVIDWRVPATA